MSKDKIILVVLVFLIAIAGINGCSSYNNMVAKEKQVEAQWHQVENQYQRRMDLIPNLVATVKSYANFEKSTLQAVTDARANATKITIDPSKLDAQSLQQFEQAQSAISQSLGRLLAVAENYPDLKANQNYLDLQAQLEGTENRIATERMRFNEVVQDYNTYIQQFPGNIWSGIFKFQPKSFFEAAKGADKPVNVDSLFNK